MSCTSTGTIGSGDVSYRRDDCVRSTQVGSTGAADVSCPLCGAASPIMSLPSSIHGQWQSSGVNVRIETVPHDMTDSQGVPVGCVSSPW